LGGGVGEVDRGLRFGDADGHGQFGVLSEGPHGLVCHECGDQHRHLGLHVWKAHGITAATYREAHGLLRSRGLVAADLRGVLAANAAVRYSENAALARARDPAAATAARLHGAKGASAEEAADRDARMARVGRSARRGTVVTCQWCGVEFCPLTGASRRRFCSRSCASRHNRVMG
jgi:hypothetical protein